MPVERSIFSKLSYTSSLHTAWASILLLTSIVCKLCKNEYMGEDLQLEQLNGKMQLHRHWKQCTHHIQLPRTGVLPLQLPIVVDHASPKVCQRLSSRHYKNGKNSSYTKCYKLKSNIANKKICALIRNNMHYESVK